MSLSIVIQYKNPDREVFVRPVSFQSVLVQYWWPLARKLQLEYVSMFETLSLSEKEHVLQLIDELDILEAHLNKSDKDVPQNTRDYMLKRINELKSYLEDAISEWEEIEGIGL